MILVFRSVHRTITGLISQFLLIIEFLPASHVGPIAALALGVQSVCINTSIENRNIILPLHVWYKIGQKPLKLAWVKLGYKIFKRWSTCYTLLHMCLWPQQTICWRKTQVLHCSRCLFSYFIGPWSSVFSMLVMTSTLNWLNFWLGQLLTLLNSQLFIMSTAKICN